MAEIWAAATAAAVGVGGLALTAKGQSDQNKANRAANQAALDASERSDRQSWLNYLGARGVSPIGDIATGEIPTTGNYRAVNTKLPIWATRTRPKQRGSFTKVPELRKIGAAPKATSAATTTSDDAGMFALANAI